MISCAIAGWAAGVNFAGVLLLAVLWARGAHELRDIEKGLRLAEAARKAREEGHGNGL